MENNARNFSLVSFLSGEEYKQVRELQKELSTITGSRKCLEDWLPHITIGGGVTISENQMLGLENQLTEISHSQNSVIARIKGFAGIENWKGAIEGKITPYVIWLEVETNPDLTQMYNTLQNKVVQNYNTWVSRTTNYTPHVTLAFADLTREGYKKGIQYLASQKN